MIFSNLFVCVLSPVFIGIGHMALFSSDNNDKKLSQGSQVKSSSLLSSKNADGSASNRVTSTVKTLKSKYGPEYQEITSFFNEKDMDSNELEYLGQNRYLYRNTVIISFENSPAQVMVEWIRY